MGQLVFKAALGGTTSLVGPNTTSTNSLTIPNASGPLAWSTTALTSTRVPFVGTSGQLQDTANLVFDGSVLSLNGNLNFVGSNVITGDFTTATRVTFKTSGANLGTYVTDVPNGSAVDATIGVAAGADLANTSSCFIRTDTSIAGLYAFKTGTGSYLPLTFHTGGSERVRINTAGFVGIGTNNPTSTLSVSASQTGGLVVFANSATGDSRALQVQNTSVTGIPNGLLYVSNSNDTNNTTYNGIQFVAGTTTRFIVYGNGAVNATGAYTNISDERIKKDIVDATPKLDDLMKVRVVNYTRTDHENNPKEIGVISQELEQIFPNMVMEVEEKDADGNVTCPDRKLVKYSVFVPMLIKAVQELNARLAKLEGA